MQPKRTLNDRKKDVRLLLKERKLRNAKVRIDQRYNNNTITFIALNLTPQRE